MKVELDTDEVWKLFSSVVKQLSDGAGLNGDDKAAMTRWRSREMKVGSEEVRVLTQKVNEDLGRALRLQEKSAVRKPDWQ